VFAARVNHIALSPLTAASNTTPSSTVVTSAPTSIVQILVPPLLHGSTSPKLASQQVFRVVTPGR
jgi:hypothetical protein